MPSDAAPPWEEVERVLQQCEAWTEEPGVDDAELRQREEACARVYEFMTEGKGDAAAKMRLERASIKWTLLQRLHDSSLSDVVATVNAFVDALAELGFDTVKDLRCFSAGEHLARVRAEIPGDVIDDASLCDLLTCCPLTPVLDLSELTELRSLPDVGTFTGTLNVSGLRHLARLPDDTHIQGSLALVDSGLVELPRRLGVEGDLLLTRCARLDTSSPIDGLVVHGNMVLARSAVRKLDGLKRLYVKGDLDCDRCERLERIGSNIKVKGALCARDCVRLRKIGSAIEVGSFLELQGCVSLRSIPGSLSAVSGLGVSRCAAISFLDLPVKRVHGSLFAAHMDRLERLPRKLEVVDKTLNLAGNTRLRELPDSLREVGVLNTRGCTLLERLPAELDVKGACDLSECAALRRLPSSLSAGALWLRGCTSLTNLPVNLRVRGDLDLFGCTNLRKLPEDIRERVGGRITLWNCPNLVLPRGWTVKGDLYVPEGVDLLHLPDGLEVRGDSWIARNSMPRFPSNFKPRANVFATRSLMLETVCDDLLVPGMLVLSHSRRLRSLGRNMRVSGMLDLEGCVALQDLGNLEVGGSLNLRGCVGLRELPQGLRVGGSLVLEGCVGITALPACIFEWGPPQEGDKHDIYLGGSGIPRGSVERLSAAQKRHLRFYTGTDAAEAVVSELADSRYARAADLAHRRRREASPPPSPRARRGRREIRRGREVFVVDGLAGLGNRHASSGGAGLPEHFSTVSKALQFWAHLAGVEAADVEPCLDAAHKRGVLTFLTRLRESKEFASEVSQPGLAKRVVEAFDLIALDEFSRAEVVSRMVDSVDACGDKPVWALGQIMLVAEIARARGDRAALRRVGRGVMRLEVVHAHCLRKLRAHPLADDVCVFLRFETALKGALELPVSSCEMLYPSFVAITEAELEAALVEALKIEDGAEAFEAWLLAWPEWQRQMRFEASRALRWDELPRNSRRFSRSWTDVFGNDNLRRPVRMGPEGAIWSMDDLLKHWVATGMDLNNQPRSVDEIRKLTRARSLRRRGSAPNKRDRSIGDTKKRTSRRQLLRAHRESTIAPDQTFPTASHTS